MDKALSLLSMARKGRRIEVGEEPVDVAIRTGHARLTLVAKDASEHTLRRIKNALAQSTQPYLRVPYTKVELGEAMGRGVCAVAALTDVALAHAFVSSLDRPEQYADLLASLDKRAQRIRQRKTLHKDRKSVVEEAPDRTTVGADQRSARGPEGSRRTKYGPQPTCGPQPTFGPKPAKASDGVRRGDHRSPGDRNGHADRRSAQKPAKAPDRTQTRREHKPYNGNRNHKK